MERYYGVIFEGGSNVYYFKSIIKLDENGAYRITNDLGYTYPTPVKVFEIINTTQYILSKSKRTITRVDVLSMPSKRNNLFKPTDEFEVKMVYFNKERKTTTVRWADNSITTVRCSQEDVFNEMTGIAMCFMKKATGGSGGFNKILKKWTNNAIYSIKRKKKKEWIEFD